VAALLKAREPTVPPVLAPSPPDPVIGLLQEEVVALRVTVDSQQHALVALSAAHRDADERATVAEQRAHALEIVTRNLVRAESCELISWHPCIRNVHVGIHGGWGVTAAAGTVHTGPQVGVGLQWSP
jgi:hypothetical protein